MSIKDKAPGCIVTSIYFLTVIFIVNYWFKDVYERNFAILGFLGIFAVLFILIKIVDKD